MKKCLLPILILMPLLLTALFYLWFREGMVFYQVLGLESQQQVWVTNDIINALPSFAHVYSLSLVTWWINGKKYALFSVVLWVIINSAFELGQRLNSDQIQHFPALIADYFANGHYSHYDMMAILTGAVVAYVTILQLHKAKDS